METKQVMDRNVCKQSNRIHKTLNTMTPNHCEDSEHHTLLYLILSSFQSSEVNTCPIAKKPHNTCWHLCLCFCIGICVCARIYVHVCACVKDLFNTFNPMGRFSGPLSIALQELRVQRAKALNSFISQGWSNPHHTHYMPIALTNWPPYLTA
jgi:hypothetical protein